MRKTSDRTPTTSNKSTPTPAPASSARRTISRSESKDFVLDDDRYPGSSMVRSITSVEWLRRPSSVNEKVMQMQRQSDDLQDTTPQESLPRESPEEPKDNESYSDTDEEEEDEEDDKPAETVKKPKKKLAPMEYDLEHMYPEISVLTRNKKRDWDFSDPDVIRALWLETKTNVLADWRVKAAKIDFRKNPKIEVRSTLAEKLRTEYLNKKAEEAMKSDESDFYLVSAGKEEPVFGPINIVSNLTTDMRFKYIRNNPPVPGRYIEHFSKYGKPPFTLHAAPCKNT